MFGSWSGGFPHHFHLPSSSHVRGPDVVCIHRPSRFRGLDIGLTTLLWNPRWGDLSWGKRQHYRNSSKLYSPLCSTPEYTVHISVSAICATATIDIPTLVAFAGDGWEEVTCAMCSKLLTARVKMRTGYWNVVNTFHVGEICSNHKWNVQLQARHTWHKWNPMDTQ